MIIRQWLITFGDIPCKIFSMGPGKGADVMSEGGGESAGGGLVSLSLALSLCNPRTHVLKLIFHRFNWGPVVALQPGRPANTGASGKLSGRSY